MGEGHIFGFIDELNECTEISKTPINEMLDDGYVIIPFSEAVEHIQQADEKRFIKPFSEISEEQFYEMFEVLPPEKWVNITNGFMFRMSEYTTSNITAHYIKIGDRHFSAERRTSTSYKEMIEEVEEIISKYPEGYNPNMFILNDPTDIDSNRIRNQIYDSLDKGLKTSEMKLKLRFVAPDNIVKELSDKFQVLKNQVAFRYRN